MQLASCWPVTPPDFKGDRSLYRFIFVSSVLPLILIIMLLYVHTGACSYRLEGGSDLQSWRCLLRGTISYHVSCDKHKVRCALIGIMAIRVCFSLRTMKLRSMLVRNPGAGVLWSGVTGQVRFTAIYMD